VVGRQSTNGERNPWPGKLPYKRLAAFQRGEVGFLRSPPFYLNLTRLLWLPVQNPITAALTNGSTTKVSPAMIH
jgi:hypothetical protein